MAQGGWSRASGHSSTGAHAAITTRSPWPLVGLFGSLVLVGAARVFFLSGAEPSVAGEAATVAQAYAATQVASGPGLGSAQLAVYAWATDAFDRAPTAMTAVREAMVVAAVAGGALLWILARRVGLRPWGATAAVTLMAVSPLAIGVQRVALPENLAVVWVLAALVLLCAPRERPRLSTDLLAAVALVIAVLTAPLSLAVVPAAGLLALRGRTAFRPVMVVGLPVAVVLVAVAADTWLRPRLPVETGALGEWFGLDPVIAAVWAVAAVAGCFLVAVRPLAIGALVLIGAALWPAAPRVEAVALVAPLGALLAVAVVDPGIRVPASNGRGRHALRRRFAASTLVVIGLVVAAAVPGWVRGFGTLGTGPSGQSTFADATDWLRANVSGSPVLADDTMWAELRRANWTRVVRASACAGACPATDWAVAVRPQGIPTGPAAIALFGDGRWRVQISRLAASATGDEDESTARRNAGLALLASPRLAVADDVAALIRDGRADPRLLITLAALVAMWPAQVTAMPAQPGEEATNQPRRAVLITANGSADQLVHFFLGQQGVFRPDSATATPDGVLVRYPPVAPRGLLAAFAGS